MTGPEVDEYGVEKTEEREAPGDCVDDGSFSVREELVDDSSKKKNVNDSPNQKRPRSRSDVCFFAGEINVGWGSDGVNVGSKE